MLCVLVGAVVLTQADASCACCLLLCCLQTSCRRLEAQKHLDQGGCCFLLSSAPPCVCQHSLFCGCSGTPLVKACCVVVQAKEMQGMGSC